MQTETSWKECSYINFWFSSLITILWPFVGKCIHIMKSSRADDVMQGNMSIKCNTVFFSLSHSLYIFIFRFEFTVCFLRAFVCFYIFRFFFLRYSFFFVSVVFFFFFASMTNSKIAILCTRFNRYFLFVCSFRLSQMQQNLKQSRQNTHEIFVHCPNSKFECCESTAYMHTLNANAWIPKL